MDTFTVGIAILSFSVKSATDLTTGLREIRYSGIALIADTPRTSPGVPTVFVHSATNPGSPGTAKFSLPESSASFIMLPPEIVIHVTVTGPRPCKRECFSINFSCSITISGR